MVCNRCVMAVESVLHELDLPFVSVNLGEIEFDKKIAESDKKKLQSNLEKMGFEILSDSNSRLIEKIKKVLIDLIQNKNNDINTNLSNYLNENLQQDYSKLSNLFSQVEGISIEKYFINLKIEKVKELIFYDELSLNEIADMLNYSSAAHLSNQFKKTTGFSPSQFKKLNKNTRKQLDKI